MSVWNVAPLNFYQKPCFNPASYDHVSVWHIFSSWTHVAYWRYSNTCSILNDKKITPSLYTIKTLLLALSLQTIVWHWAFPLWEIYFHKDSPTHCLVHSKNNFHNAIQQNPNNDFLFVFFCFVLLNRINCGWEDTAIWQKNPVYLKHRNS